LAQDVTIYPSCITIIFAPQEVPRSGVDTVVFYESPVFWILVIVFCIILSCVLAISSYVGYRLNRYRKKWRATKKALTSETDAEMVVFSKEHGGVVAVKKEDKVEYDSNPLLVMQQDRLQRELAGLGSLDGSDGKKDEEIEGLKARQEQLLAELARLKKQAEMGNSNAGTERKVRRKKKTRAAFGQEGSSMKKTTSAAPLLAPAPSVPEKVTSMWDEVTDPASGRPYYVHRETRETSWTRPE